MTLVRVGGMAKYPNGFWAGKYEVTEGDYLKVIGRNFRPEPLPMARGLWRRGVIRTNTFRVDATHPQVMVTAQQAADFCAKLTEMEKSNGRLPPGTDYYALPTEEQWEYFVGDAHLDDAITSKGHTSPRTKPEPVGGTRRANRYGLHDVRGNVWELCLAPDGSPWMRGGAFDSAADTGVFGTLAPSYRNQAPASPSTVVGFRIVCIPASSAPTAQK
jgi:formylglycine-generating enzyme required for sulfatase activity